MSIRALNLVNNVAQFVKESLPKNLPFTLNKTPWLDTNLNNTHASSLYFKIKPYLPMQYSILSFDWLVALDFFLLVYLLLYLRE